MKVILFQFEKFVLKKKISQLEACLKFIKQNKIYKIIIIGINNVTQLREIIFYLKKKRKTKLNFNKFSQSNEKLLLSYNWKIK